MGDVVRMFPRKPRDFAGCEHSMISLYRHAPTEEAEQYWVVCLLCSACTNMIAETSTTIVLGLAQLRAHLRRIQIDPDDV